MRDAIHPENWEEYARDGWEWTGRNGRFGEGRATHLDIDLVTWAGWDDRVEGVGRQNVATGDPFDQESGRPTRRDGEYGVYWRPGQP